MYIKYPIIDIISKKYIGERFLSKINNRNNIPVAMYRYFSGIFKLNRLSCGGGERVGCKSGSGAGGAGGGAGAEGGTSGGGSM